MAKESTLLRVARTRLFRRRLLAREVSVSLGQVFGRGVKYWGLLLLVGFAMSHGIRRCAAQRKTARSVK